MESALALELDWLRASWQRNASAVEAGGAGFSRLYLGMPARGAGAQASGTSALIPVGQRGRAEAAGMGSKLLASLLDPESGLAAAGTQGARARPTSGLGKPAIDRFSSAEGRAAQILALLALFAGFLAWILAKGKARGQSGSAARTVDEGRSMAYPRAAGRPRLAMFKSGLQRLAEGLAGRSDASLALLYGLCIGINAFGPQPFSLVALLPMAIVALARPPLALAAVAAALPFHYALRMKLGPQPVAIVEILLGLAIAGRILWAWLRVPMRDVARVEPRPVNMGPDGAGPDGVGPVGVGPDGVGPYGSGSDAAGPNGAGLGGAGLKKSGRSLLLWAWSLWSGMPGLDRLALLLVLWSGLSPLWAPRPTHAIYEWRTVMLEPALFYLLLRNWPDRRAAARLALDGLILGAFLAGTMALAGLAIIAGGGQASWATAVEAEGVFRARGPYGSPNNLALYLGRVLPLLVAGLIWHRGPRRRLELLALLPVAAALLASFSRGSIILGLPALALYGLLLAGGRMRRALTWLSLSGLALVLLILPFADSERVRGTFSLRPGTTAYYRLRLWQSAWRMIQDHPWLGVGLDNFLYLYRDRYVQRDVVQERGLSHPHNLLLDAWTRLGLPGLLILLLLVIGNLRAGIRAIAATAKRAGTDHAMVVGALGMQIYGLAHGLIDNSFFLVDLAAMWWIAQAALMALGAAPEARAASAPEDGGARRFALRDMAEEPAALARLCTKSS
jgi:O-antigen ligase